MSVTQWPHLQERETPTTGPDSQRDCDRWWGYDCYLCCERFFPAWLPLYDSCGKLGGVDSEKKDTDSFSGKLTKLCFYSESFYAWEQGKNLQKSRLHRWSLSTYKVDNSKFTKLMRHIDSIFSGSRDNLLSSRPALFSCSPKAVYAGNVSRGKTSRHAWRLWPFARSLWGPSPQGSHVVYLNNSNALLLVLFTISFVFEWHSCLPI